MVGPRDPVPDTAYVAAGVAAIALLAFTWALFGDASLTYDEATYADLAAHPMRSTYYGTDLFLRHPPLAFLALDAWSAVAGSSEMALRALGVLWSAVGVVFLGLALRARYAPAPWLLIPAASLPAVVGLVSVSMYPPMFAFLSMAAWAHATDRRRTGFVAWNLAMLAHEIAILCITFALVPAAWRALREVRPVWRVPLRWLRLSAPYPAAWLWGLIILGGSFTRSDPRTGDVAGGLVSPEALLLLSLEPVYSAIILLAVTPVGVWLGLAAWRAGRGSHGPGIAAFGVLLAVLSPFYRYIVAPLPLLFVHADGTAPGWFSGRRGLVVVLASGLMATGASVAFIDRGWDAVNLADVPGRMDHRAATTLVADGGVIGLRSPPALAHYLRAEGWQVVDVAPDGPSTIDLTRDDVTLRLVRIETQVTAMEDRDLDGALVPEVWRGRIAGLEAAGWTRVGAVDGLVRLDAP